MGPAFRRRVSFIMVAMDTTDMTDDLDAALAEHIASFDRGSSYRVERQLKTSEVETTELVYFEGAGGGSLGPFVRKRIDTSAQIGSAYERLFAAQRAGVRFEHLPRLLDCWRAGDELEVVMEYIEGETLESLVARLGATPDYARDLFPALCDAVAELHGGFAVPGEPAVPVIHRDLKPSNIMVSGVSWTPERGMTFSSLVIIDLGIARTWREGASADTVKFGTRPYAPPEQYGFGQTSVRSDVYALGALLFFCLTGRDPKPGVSMGKQCAERGVPEPLADVVCKAMALDPEQRFACATALGNAAQTAYGSLVPERKAAPKTVRSRSRQVPDTPTEPEPQDPKATASVPVDDSFEARHPASVRIARLLAPIGRILSRVPSSIGVMWNVMMYATFILMVFACISATFSPTGANRFYPRWFLVIEYFGMVLPMAFSITIVLLDKRRWRRRLPILEGLRGARLVYASLLLFLVPMALTCLVIVIANATGVLA